MKATEDEGMAAPSRQISATPVPPSEPALKLPDQPARPTASVMLPALLAGVLHWLCYFPVNLGWLGWVALVPLLTLVRSPARPRRVYFAAWLGGLAFFVPALHWFAYPENKIMVVLGMALAVYCALYWPLAIALLRRLDSMRLPLCVTVPVVWTASEFLRAHALTGFPWYFLSHSQHDFLAIIQIADLGGAYAVTFLVAAVNAVVFDWLSARGAVRKFFMLPDRPLTGLKPLTFVVAGALAVALWYGWYRLGQDDFAPGPRVALLQGNVEQRIRNQATTTDAERDALVGGMLGHYHELTEKAMRKQPDLLVWPETSFPDEWWELTPDFAAANLAGLDSRVQWESIIHDHPNWRPLATLTLNRDIVGPLRRWSADILVGIGCRVQRDGDREHGTRFNSAVLVRDVQDPDYFSYRYDKIHRVPFGEYLPFRDSLPFIKVFSPYEQEYGIQSGERFTRFPLGKPPLPRERGHYGVLICFEDTDPYLARQYVRPGGEGEPVVDFLLNISNDGWFGGSAEHDQHLAICRFRAIECRRSIGRSVNMGISAVIDGNGRVIALPGKDWKSSKSVAGVVTADIPIDHRQSLYARWGDWLPAGCWLVLACGLVISVAKRQRHPV